MAAVEEIYRPGKVIEGRRLIAHKRKGNGIRQVAQQIKSNLGLTRTWLTLETGNTYLAPAQRDRKHKAASGDARVFAIDC